MATEVIDAVAATDLVPREQTSPGLVLPVGTPDEMRQAMRLYEETKNAILDPSDWQEIPREGKFIKKSGWAKLAIAFGVSSEIKDGYPKSEHDSDGNLIGSECIVRAFAPNGRSAEGWGYCSIDESRFTGRDGRPQGRQKLAHDLPATSETRARNRAYAALFAHGEVSAEEVQAPERAPERPEPAPKGNGELAQLIETLASAENESKEKTMESLQKAMPGIKGKRLNQLSEGTRENLRALIVSRLNELTTKQQPEVDQQFQEETLPF